MAPKGQSLKYKTERSSLWVNRFNREFTGNTHLDWLQNSQISLFPLQDHHLSSPLRDRPACSKRTAWVARGDKEARYQQTLVLEWTKRQVTSGASCCRGRSNGSSVTSWKPLDTFQSPPRRRGREVKGPESFTQRLSRWIHFKMESALSTHQEFTQTYTNKIRWPTDSMGSEYPTLNEYEENHIY